jgi:hypothetical protein
MNKRTAVICQLFDHDWIYKDYALYRNADGNPFPYTVARKCMRCGKTEVNAKLSETSWKTEVLLK